MHDGWTPYRRYDVTHQLCCAHLLRELRAAFEDGQSWAEELSAFLCATHERVEAARAAGATALPTRTLNSLARRYDELIVAGHGANPAPTRTGQPGRPSRTKAANLVHRLDLYREDVLRFATDFTSPFDNNQAERDLRMVKLQQKISGCYRTEAGATNYLTIRSYCQRPFEIPHRRPKKFPGHGHLSPRVWPPNSPRGNDVSHLPRGFTPLPLVASCRRIDSPDVCTTWA